jgi:phosphoribosylglycinamide formyltransferase-1
VRITVSTVHFVDHGTDTGPIIAQAAVPVRPGDDVEALRARVLLREHELYPRVLQWIACGKVRVLTGEGKRPRVAVDGDTAWGVSEVG